MDFASRYKKLNDQQRRAVDQIDGPVMVVAGPGTGKTELLSMRAANILKQTDVLPENILCLTFTEAGSIAMQKRLIDIIGRDAYGVSIFTFHAFGTEIMNKYREYFYSGAEVRPADDLARHRIITEILDSLDYNNPLRSRMNGSYTAIGDIISAISDLKRAGLTDAEFGLLLDATQSTVEQAGKLLSEVFTSRVSKGTKDTLAAILPQIEAIEEVSPISGISTLKDALASSLAHTLAAAEAHEKTTPPLSDWKKEWMTASIDKTSILKAQKTLPKLRALQHVYGLYLQIMAEAQLIDYDDMIMQVVHAMEVHDDLRYDLQEKYQYIMVDEFQDTNLAQMRILHNLINNPVVEDQPNILVVGDDDQAIYGFQGAEIGNILTFKDAYSRTELVTLTDNYRSVQPVLDSAREVIIQGTERLERHMPELDKTLTAHRSGDSDVRITQYVTIHDERQATAAAIRQLRESGVSASEIAIIARKHSDLVNLLSYLNSQDVPVSYDRRDNVLDDEIIMQLEHVGTIVHALSTGQHDQADTLLPELISHPAWGVSPSTVWEISLTARKNRVHWLETMREFEATQPLFSWLIAASGQALHLPLERMIDVLIGNEVIDGGYVSPLKNYFFAEDKRQGNLARYTAHLENLITIRRRLREHASGTTAPKLAEFLDFMQQNRETDTRITSYRHIGEDDHAVRLLTAHGSKGLEFDHVFVVNATDPMWGEKASGRSPSISFPPHLRLRQNADNYDERLRLFYVAMTRARNGLHISYATENDSAKETLRAAFLLGSGLHYQEESASDGSKALEDAALHQWYAPIINIPAVDMQQYLAPILQTYKISASHINNFIDVSHGGPQQFLLNYLLRLPQAIAPANGYGIAVHAALQRAHDHLRATGSHLPEEDILREFDKHLETMPLTDDEHRHYQQQGSDALRTFLAQKYESFVPDQQAELSFAGQEVRIGEAILTGKLDVIQFDKDSKTAIVTDYKTGSPLTSWEKGADYQKVKAHKYRQQLLFYKLLVEHSRDWHNYTMSDGILQFVEPNDSGAIVDLRLSNVDPAELERFTRLITVIWQRIMALDFPDTSNYSQDYAGIVAFESDLLTDSQK